MKLAEKKWNEVKSNIKWEKKVIMKGRKKNKKNDWKINEIKRKREISKMKNIRKRKREKEIMKREKKGSKQRVKET